MLTFDQQYFRLGTIIFICTFYILIYDAQYGVREGALRKIYAYVYIFRKAPSRTWRVREGALRKIYAYVYIFRKAPSRTWRVREGALRTHVRACHTTN